MCGQIKIKLAKNTKEKPAGGCYFTNGVQSCLNKTEMGM